MIDSGYANALTGAGGGRVCGYRLYVLTPRHILGLSMAGSPYVTGGVCDFQDTVIAARILSARNEKQWRRAVLGGGWLRDKLSAASVWLRSVIYGERFWRSIDALRAWMDTEMIMPNVMQGQNDGKRLSSPWLQLMVCRIARECGKDVSAAWWVRFADAAWSNIAWQELDGAEIRLMDDAQRAEFLAMGWEEKDLP